MEPLKAELLESLKGIRAKSTVVPMFSTVTGLAIEGPELDGAYWCKNIRNTVLFADAVDELIQADYDIFLELAPHPVLAASITKCLSQSGKEGTVMHSLRRQEPELTQMLSSFGRLYTLGYPFDWNRLFPGGGRFVKLPSYPWQKERHWHESEKSQRDRLGQKVHPLLGTQMESAYPAWAVELDKNTPAYLNDHRVQGSLMYPGSAYVEMALAAARESFGQETCVLEDITLLRPIILSDKESLTVQLVLDSKQTSFDIYSRTDGEGSTWVRHATGKLRRLQERETSNQVALEEIRRRCDTEIYKRDFYQRFYEVGLQYGARFQGVMRLWCGKRESFGEVQVHSDLEMEFRDYLLHPAMLDSCFQLILGAVASEQKYDVKGVYLPVHMERLRLYGRPDNKLYCHALLTEWDAGHLKANIELLDYAGKTVAEIQGFRCQFVPNTSEKTDSYLYEYKWKLAAREDQASVNRSTDHIVSPPQIAKRLKPEAKRLSGELDRKKYYESLEHKLRVLVSTYILNAFQKLGWKFSTRQPISFNSLRKRLGVIPEQQKFFERLLQMLEEDGSTKEIGGRWKFTRLPKMKDPQEIWKSLWTEFPAYLAELILLRQCGDNLAEVPRGKVDPLELLFPQGSLTTLEHLYQDSPSIRVYNLLVQKAIATALEKLPEGRTIRILELGGGTGGMTSYVLRKLPQDRTE
jgi:acyl transferase domain-containing protein